MKYLILVILVAGCNQKISPEKLKELATKCDKNDGLEVVYQFDDHSDFSAKCNDGAEFRIKYEHAGKL